MEHATYVGPLGNLRGCTALLRPRSEDNAKVLAQFDGTDRLGKREVHRDGINLTLGWHEFNASDFKADEKEPT